MIHFLFSFGPFCSDLKAGAVIFISGNLNDGPKDGDNVAEDEPSPTVFPSQSMYNG